VREIRRNGIGAGAATLEVSYLVAFIIPRVRRPGYLKNLQLWQKCLRYAKKTPWRNFQTIPSRAFPESNCQARKPGL